MSRMCGAETVPLMPRERVDAVQHAERLRQRCADVAVELRHDVHREHEVGAHVARDVGTARVDHRAVDRACARRVRPARTSTGSTCWRGTRPRAGPVPIVTPVPVCTSVATARNGSVRSSNVSIGSIPENVFTMRRPLMMPRPDIDRSSARKVVGMLRDLARDLVHLGTGEPARVAEADDRSHTGARDQIDGNARPRRGLRARRRARCRTRRRRRAQCRPSARSTLRARRLRRARRRDARDCSAGTCRARCPRRPVSAGSYGTMNGSQLLSGSAFERGSARFTTRNTRLCGALAGERRVRVRERRPTPRRRMPRSRRRVVHALVSGEVDEDRAIGVAEQAEHTVQLAPEAVRGRARRAVPTSR